MVTIAQTVALAAHLLMLTDPHPHPTRCHPFRRNLVGQDRTNVNLQHNNTACYRTCRDTGIADWQSAKLLLKEKSYVRQHERSGGLRY